DKFRETTKQVSRNEQVRKSVQIFLDPDIRAKPAHIAGHRNLRSKSEPISNASIESGKGSKPVSADFGDIKTIAWCSGIRTHS
ncbi:MAG: hypothetical protein ACYCQJ_16215, partial [Nitrososphaerales archaeon]